MESHPIFLLHRPSMTVTRHKARIIPRRGDLLMFSRSIVRVLNVTFQLAPYEEETCEHSIYVEVERADEETFEYGDVQDLEPDDFFRRLR